MSITNSTTAIITQGFFGDILFQSGVARGLTGEVDFYIQFPQMEELLRNNPWISNVFVNKPLHKTYDREIYMRPYDIGKYTPPVESKIQANLSEDTISTLPAYTVYTSLLYDNWITDQFRSLPRPIVSVMANWQEKTYLFTEEQYRRGIDVPNKGYGGSWRNTDQIIQALKVKGGTYILVGKPIGYSQYMTDDINGFTQAASILKYSDFFIGAEGGLANLAAGVGTRTILTGDYVHQLYGWNGVIRKLTHPLLGPHLYFPNDGHISLNPYLTDAEVVNEITHYIYS